MKKTKERIENALKKLKNRPFSIKEIVETSGASDPTVRTYLKNYPIREVSYGKYELIEKGNSTKTPILEDKKDFCELVSEKLAKSIDPQDINRQEDTEEITEVDGDLYLKSYLKGFDRGFELGLKRAKEVQN